MRLKLLLLTAALALPAHADKLPTMGGEVGMDLTCVPMPGEPAGHFVCEDRESYQRCKALVGKGEVRLEGTDEPVAVLRCEQGG